MEKHGNSSSIKTEVKMGLSTLGNGITAWLIEEYLLRYDVPDEAISSWPMVE